MENLKDQLITVENDLINLETPEFLRTRFEIAILKEIKECIENCIEDVELSIKNIELSIKNSQIAE